MYLSLYPRMLCYVFWSQVEYEIIYFISMLTQKNGTVVNANIYSVVITPMMTYCTFQRFLENIIRQRVHCVLLRLVHSVTGFGGIA